MALNSKIDFEGLGGTRFKLFAQPPFLPGFEEPEIVMVSSPAGSLGIGPSDDRMYTVYPTDKPVPYGERVDPNSPQLAPPWIGDTYEPAVPDEEGHFDYLDPGTPQFEMAHFFGTTCFVLDIWEEYFGRPIHWHFKDLYERMELVITPAFPNATMGFGFMEAGGYHLDSGEYRPFSLNFDVIAHEVGHSIIYPEMGLPTNMAQSEYFGFHEAAADLVAIISSLHFPSVVDDLMSSTRGNLYALNKVIRIGELTRYEQIRVAANSSTMYEFVQGWTDEHMLAQPLTAAVVDTLIDIFHELLVDRGLLAPDIEDLSDSLEQRPYYADLMQPHFDELFINNPDAVTSALLDARDFVGVYLARSFGMLSTEDLTYAKVLGTFLETDLKMNNGAFGNLLNNNFAKRGIGTVSAGPRLSPPNEDSHFFSIRTEFPMRGSHLRQCSSYYAKRLHTNYNS